MKLTKIDFDILTGDCKKYSRELVDKLKKTFHEVGLLREGKLTRAGLDLLEPYRVHRAIFIAAGLGERLLPVTLNTPKPMIKVHGTRIIDRLIDACLAAEIEEIYIVRGYLSPQFDFLIEKYPMIKFIENPIYDKANNIYSAVCAAHLMKNAYVLEADLLIRNPALIRKYEFTTNFLGIKMERSEDWCFDVRDDVIVNQKIGGTNCWQEVGISYWNEAEGAKLEQDLPEAFNLPGGNKLYWDQVPLVIFSKNYRVEIRSCNANDIVEIDTFDELTAIDDSYKFKEEV